MMSGSDILFATIHVITDWPIHVITDWPLYSETQRALDRGAARSQAVNAGA
ncbi:unnamed protein product, partial [Staurois parvus]